MFYHWRQDHIFSRDCRVMWTLPGVGCLKERVHGVHTFKSLSFQRTVLPRHGPSTLPVHPWMSDQVLHVTQSVPRPQLRE